MSSVAFGVVAALMLASAIMVVRATNLVRAVLWLGITLVSTAGFFAIASAPFLATVQVLLYVGGVMTLMIFGVMLTRRHDGLAVAAESRRTWRGALVAGLFFAVMAAAIMQPNAFPAALEAPVPDTAALGAVLFGEQLLAFEVLSLLLLAAIVGAAVIARRRDHGASAGEPIVRLGHAVRPEEAR